MFKSYNFWVRLVAVLVLLARIVLNEFGISIDSGLIMDIATAVAGVLVVLGVIQVPSGTTADKTNNNKNFGGEFMENLEQIKSDLISAREEILTEFGEKAKNCAFMAVLNKILGGFGEETEVVATPVKEAPVTVNQEGEEETAVSVEEKEVESEIEQPQIEEIQEVVIEQLSQEKEPDVLKEQEIGQEIEAITAEIEEDLVVDVAVSSGLTEDEKSRLREILRSKINELVKRDSAEIIESVIA